jgi:hypothetical protein
MKRLSELLLALQQQVLRAVVVRKVDTSRMQLAPLMHGS